MRIPKASARMAGHFAVWDWAAARTEAEELFIENLLAVPPTAGSSLHAPAGLLARGSGPCLPAPSRFRWLRCGVARRLQLRGQLRNWKPGLGPSSPHSHLIPRRVSRRRGTKANPLWVKGRGAQALCGSELGLRGRAVSAFAAADTELHRGARVFPAEPHGKTPPPAAHA